MKARWIRLGAIGQADFEAACASIAAAQPRDAAPLLLWGEEAARYPFALIAPLKYAPGRVQRWLSWGLAAAVATYRQFGVPAYLDDELFLHGRDIARSRASAMGECAVITSSSREGVATQLPGKRIRKLEAITAHSPIASARLCAMSRPCR